MNSNLICLQWIKEASSQHTDKQGKTKPIDECPAKNKPRQALTK